MSFDDEVLIDEEVRKALDEVLLTWDGVSAGRMLDGVSYETRGEPFALLMEGTVAAKLEPSTRAQALSLAGVSPFRPPSGDGGEFPDWVQFVLLLPEDVEAVTPWLEAAYKQATHG